jgi:cytochrome c biogenesis protein CcmG/thiol:disulfide interchange protein DsbE
MLNRLIKLVYLTIALGTLIPVVATATEEGVAAPDFSLPGVRPEDPQIVLSELQGNIVYVDFWASWCLPCIRSLPQINELFDKYRTQGFSVVAITIDSPIEDALDFLADLEVPIAYHVVSDITADIMDEYGVIGMPTSFLIDRQGIVRKVHAGFREGDTALLEQALITLLAEQPYTP